MTEQDDLRSIGDRLQSAASRMAEWIVDDSAQKNPPYEVVVAALEAEKAVAEWTDARAHTALRALADELATNVGYLLEGAETVCAVDDRSGWDIKVATEDALARYRKAVGK